MKVREIMTRDVEICTPQTNLAAAGELMWNRDCGSLPVVANSTLVGVLTDRDVCIALATRNVPAAEVLVNDLVTHEPWVCHGEDDVSTALEIMRDHRVRRLPVVNMAGRLEGMLSMNDIILRAVPNDRSVSLERTVETLKAICAHTSCPADTEPETAEAAAATGA